MDTLGANDGGRTVLISVEFVPDSSTDPVASRIPSAVVAAAISLAAVAAFFATDDGVYSVFNDSGALRAGRSCETYTGIPSPESEVDFSGSFDAGGADVGGE